MLCRLLPILLLLAVPAFAEDGKKRPMTVADLWNLQRVGSPSISPDGAWVVVEVTKWNMEKDEAASDLWLLSTDGKIQKQLTTTPGRNSGPRWSPDVKSIAFVSKRGTDEGPQIYVISPTGGEARRVTQSPLSFSALKWSGDSKTIHAIAWTWPDTLDDEAYRKKDKEQKEQRSKAVIIDEAVYRYWDKWITDGRRPSVFAIDVATGRSSNLLAGTGKSLPPYEPSAADYDVSPDGKELCFVADSVEKIGIDVNHDLYTLPLNVKGEQVPPKNITADNPAQDSSPVYSPDGKSIAFLRQSIKFFYADISRVAVHDRATGKNTVLTGNFDRSCSTPHWTPDGKQLLFEIEDAGHHRLATVQVPQPDKPGASRPSLVIAEKEALYSDTSPAMAANGTVVFLRSSFDFPAQVHRLVDGTSRRIDTFNNAITSQWDLGKVESVTFKGADDEDVQMWVIYPPNFDPKKKWPLVQVVHGGPHNGIATDWSYRWNPQLWAAQGWVIGIVNFHGSSGFGQKFCDSITGDYGTKPLIDIQKGTDWFEKQPWIDKDRIATAGASYGGYMMAWLNGHTDRFKAMVCHAGVYSYHSQMASDIVRGRERALGAFPWKDLEKIDRQSAQRYAGNFKTPTLVLHGERDFRVPVTQGFEYYNTLKQKGVPTRLVYFPDENHWILKGQNSLVWHREVFGWLDRYIGHGPSK
jgi:dipeptidyl aminopeptidase/acylaminoacyl peptidase